MNSIISPASTTTQKKELPTCTSYKEAYKKLEWRRYITAGIALGGISVIITICFQALIAFPTRYSLFTTIRYSLILFLCTGATCLSRYSKTTLWKPISPSDASEILNLATSSDSLFAIIVQLISGLAIVQSYIWILCGDTYDRSFLVHPHGERYGLRQLNEDNLFVSFYAIVLGIAYAVLYIKEHRWVMRIPSSRQPPAMALKLSAATAVYDGTKLAFVVFGATYILYIFLDGLVYRTSAYLTSFLPWYSRVLEAPVIRLSWFDLYLFLRMILGGCVATISWIMGDRVVDVYFAVQELISKDYKNAHECLVSGLRDSKNPYVQATAFAELAEIASKHPAERAALFNDMGSNANSTAWIQISRECMNVLDTLGKDIEREYTGVKPLAPAPVRKEEVAPPNRIELKDMNVFSKPKTDTVVLDDRIIRLFASAPTPPQVMATTPETDAPKHLVIKAMERAKTQVKQWKFVQDLSAVTAERKTRRIFSNYPVLVWAIQSLGSLTAASYNEDPYGLVQRDIGKVVDTLLASVMDIERLVRSPPPSYTKLPPGYTGDRAMLMEPEFVLLGLREAIYQIVTSFREYLDDISVSKRYAKKWESFVEFRE
ncbi:nucleoporin protein Ndc1-Nup [Zychaea mexicana]|uniref:nucleoporin protein Ndc1-Nup n=1 Tax=Zychaea mexicana TaxID=64656 RepID=UPI0022FE3FAC|nr:nucleoporin protein Ndc1-Nup [Zychaea mexicana]KAI9493587.1 nucleoporin protein Ndc1-Nup [Zychaea mexicana]